MLRNPFNGYSVSLDEVVIVPSAPTVYSDDDVNVSTKIGSIKLKIPFISAAMDSVTDPGLCIHMHKWGGIGLLNLCGLFGRYSLDEYDAIAKQLHDVPTIPTLQKIYGDRKLDKKILIANFEKCKKNKLLPEKAFGVSATPQWAEKLLPVAVDYGASLVAVQASFVTPYFKSMSGGVGLEIGYLVKKMHDRGVTVIAGNVVSGKVAAPLIDSGIDGILVGIGPGTACTSRKVVGVGAGQAAAIDEIRREVETRQVKTAVIADGGIKNSGDIVKALCCGAHSVVLGGLIARTTEAKFAGLHWGMSAPHHTLPRGDILEFDVDFNCTLEKLFYGPSDSANGQFALIHSIKNALSNIGALNIQSAYGISEVAMFPLIDKEGKGWL